MKPRKKSPPIVLDGTDIHGNSFRLMSRKCEITGAKPRRGSKIHRRGLAKKKGGIGMHVTAVTPRWHSPNLKTKRVWVPELNKFVTVKATARAFKTLSKNGAHTTLAKAGVI
jgi:large subunit ribosomal protein L28